MPESARIYQEFVTIIDSGVNLVRVYQEFVTVIESDVAPAGGGFPSAIINNPLVLT